jgi:hypothetical protein
LRWWRELRPVNLLLLAGIAVLLTAIVRIWGGGEGVPFRSLAAQGPEVPKTPVLRDQQPLSAFKSVVSQNLFSQDRNAPAAQVAKVQDSLEGRQLLGTLVIGATRAAIIGGKVPGRGQGVPDVEAVYLGEEWHGLTVLEIAQDSVTFTGKDGPKTLKFPE